jgi:hypothetical protein
MRTKLFSIALAGATAALTAGALAAQEPAAEPRLALRPFVGTSIPAGAERSALGTGLLLGAQAGYDLGHRLSVIGDLSWARPTSKLVSADARTDVYQLDAGLAWGLAPVARLRPYVALGGGVRDYRYASPVLTDGSGGVGFGAVGTDFALGGAALRLEARDNVVAFAAPTADGGRTTRNDVGVSLGLTLHPHGL